MNIITINKTVGYQMKSLTVNADGTVLAQYSVGVIDESDAYKPIAERNYMIQAADAAPILNTAAVAGSAVFDQLEAAIAAALSRRTDWLA